jgi:hypothetical protein
MCKNNFLLSAAFKQAYMLLILYIYSWFLFLFEKQRPFRNDKKNHFRFTCKRPLPFNELLLTKVKLYRTSWSTRISNIGQNCLGFMSHLLSSSSPEGHIDINISSIGGRRGRAVHRHPSFTSVPGMLYKLYTYTLHLHSAHMCYIYVHTCTATLQTRVHTCFTLVRLCFTLVLTCFILVNTYFTLAHICFTPAHICFTLAHICFTPAHICFTLAHICFTPAHICFTLVHAEASYLYTHL